jgi:hypothetical protein
MAPPQPARRLALQSWIRLCATLSGDYLLRSTSKLGVGRFAE